ncbi:hypothetical protein [Massilia sp. 9096]|uniref:hypothetical protein n=1 Tax=Massilia sp. 9096 TaxID=1500894 RepID=UPI0012E03063|nr:hypothetical protein [Massilia sp. 9096]
MDDNMYRLVNAVLKLDDGESDFSDPDAALSPFTEEAINRVAQQCGVPFQTIRDELTQVSQDEDEHNEIEFELQYGHLNQDGLFPHEVEQE